MEVNGRVDATLVQQANDAFQAQITRQISRITAELKHLEDLLSFGMVDRRVLAEFRQTIDRVRTTGWQVERWLDGDERGLSKLVTEERVRVAATLAAQLASDPSVLDRNLSGLPALKAAVRKLDGALETLPLINADAAGRH